MADAPKAPEEDSNWKKGSSQFSNKRYSEYFDPCQDAANKSLKCLRRNGGDREMCQDYFEAYKECKKNWMEEMKEEKRKNAKPWFGS
ncbi:hypothetical protein WHR41_02903 [Cladosporium halotolerans]|uniref:Cytochrome c oxidase-assembly factor COX23, mitochondrial n=1 Tax=Cladosporium halotolerans TaxID=1052096 RepID=A0AB34KT28_9PEZI